MEKGRRGGETGQSSMEYALVLMAFLSLVLALSSVWHVAHEGTLQDKAREAASHNCDDGITLELLRDLAVF